VVREAAQVEVDRAEGALVAEASGVVAPAAGPAIARR